MKLKFLNKKIIISLLSGITCFTLTFLLTKGINHDEGKTLEVTSKNQKLLLDLSHVDSEILSLKKQVLGAKEMISTLNAEKETLQVSLGIELTETIDADIEDVQDTDLDLSLPEDDEDTSYYYYYEQEYYYPTYRPSGNSNSSSTNNSANSNNNSNNGNSTIIESTPEVPAPPATTLPENNIPDNNIPETDFDSDNNENITPPSSEDESNPTPDLSPEITGDNNDSASLGDN